MRFHDGTPFDAAAAKFSLDRALAPDSVNPQKSRLQAIQAIDVLDGRTLRISLNRRSGGLLQSLAWGSFIMVSPASAAGNAGHPVGTGPFRFSEWRRGDSLTLTRNTDYWGSAGRLDQATFKFIADPSAAYAALMAGDIDAFDNYPAPESFGQFAADPRFAVFVGQTEMETILVAEQPQSAVERRAGPPRPLPTRSTAAPSSMVPCSATVRPSAATSRRAIPPMSTSRASIRTTRPRRSVLLAQAGYAQGFSVTLKLPPPSYARRGGEIIAAQLAQVGIRARIENLEWAAWLDRSTRGTTSI